MKLIEPATSVHEEFLVGFYYCKRQVDEQLQILVAQHNAEIAKLQFTIQRLMKIVAATNE
jgi:hypothetical protein